VQDAANKVGKEDPHALFDYVFERTCNLFPKRDNWYFQCNHALGHGAHAVYGGINDDLESASAFCMRA
jgi:hypothetical protein